MKTTKIFMLAALALSMAACSNNDNENENVASGPREAVITAGINNPATRALGSVWESDEIGVMVTAVSGTTAGVTSKMADLYKNVRYVTTANTTDAATFTATNPGTATVPGSSAAGQTPAYGIFFQDAKETVTFAAYGPYQSSTDAATLPGTNSDGIISNISTENQNTRALQKAFDFIYASGATASNTSYTVQFKDGNAFSHKMSRLIIKFVASTDAGFAADEVSKAGSTYSLTGLTHEGTFNVKTGEAQATVPGSSAAGPTPWSLNTNSLKEVASDNSAVTFTSILYPQDHSTNGITVKATIAGQTYEATIKPNLESGKSYTYTITAKKQGLEVSGCTVTDWTNGNGDNGEAGDATLPKNN